MSSLSSIGGSSPANSSSNSNSNNSSNGTGLVGLNTSGISFQGLISGLNTDQIVQALLAPEQQEITNLQNQQAAITQLESTYNTLQSYLQALQTTVDGLATTTNSIFDGRTATSSNTNVVTASAASGAPDGVYNFTVNSVAQAQQDDSQGFASANSAITQGTFQFQVGTGAVQTITIDSSNATLQGLADAINGANAGVTASIVNDGNSSQGDVLLLTANNSGTANAITITNNLGASGGGAVQPQFSTVTPAADASISLGSGSGALTITSSTNQIQNVFNGVTLNLVSAAPTQTVSVTVANNTQATGTAVDNFVTAYNTLIGYINQNDSYNAQTKQAGILLGDFPSQSILSNLGGVASGVVNGVNSLADNLAQVGITLNADGTLAVNNTTLNSALQGQLTGVSANDVRQLFVTAGQSTNPAVQFSYAPGTLKASGVPIGVQITQAATQGTATATNALAASTTITAGSNDTFSVTVDGTSSGTLTLAAGTYTPTQLAQQVQSVINASSALHGATVTAGVNGSGDLVLTSATYGSTSQVFIGSGDALSSLGYTGTEGARGQDVAGYFVVNGVQEAATGTGQILTSNSGNAETGGLVVVSSLTPAQITGSPEATLTVTQGVAAQLNNVLNQMLDPVSGLLTTANQSLQSQASSLATTIQQQQQNMQQEQSTLLQEFVNMESTLASLQTAGNALGSSLIGFSSSSSASGGGTTA